MADLPAAVGSGADYTSSTNLTPAIQGEIQTEDPTDYPIHVTCPSCKHFNRDKRLKISRDPAIHTRFHCERCRKPLFGIGRSSTQVTFASAESREPHPLHLFVPLQTCTNRLRARSPSRLRSSVPPPSPSEPTASVPQTPEMGRGLDSVGSDIQEQQDDSGVVFKAHGLRAGVQASRRRWTARFSRLSRIPRKMFARLRARHLRRSNLQTLSSPGNDSFENHESDKLSIMDVEPHAKSEQAGVFCSPQPFPFHGTSYAQPLPSTVDRRSHSLPSSLSGHDRPIEPTRSNKQRKADQLQQRRRERTALEKKAAHIFCHCARGCLCRCTDCFCQRDSHTRSNFSSNSGTRSPPNPDAVPGHVLDRPGRPFLANVGGQFDELPLLPNEHLNGCEGRHTRLSQLSTAAGTHETRDSSTDSSTLEAVTGSSHRSLGGPGPGPRIDFDSLDAEIASNAARYRPNGHGHRSIAPTTSTVSTNQAIEEPTLENEPNIAPNNNTARHTFQAANRHDSER